MENEMFDENAFRRHAAETLDLLASLQQFRSLFKTEGGHLTQAGKATVLQGLKSGMTSNEIADLLEVSPAVVRYHWKQHAETRRADTVQAA
jgi:DNA-binding NarL/FixJ family response regulator